MKILIYHVNRQTTLDADWYICFVFSLRVVQTLQQNWQQKLEWYLSKNKTVMIMMMMKRLLMVNGVTKGIKGRHKLLRYRRNSCTVAPPRVAVRPANQKKRNLIIILTTIIIMRKKRGLSHMGNTSTESGVAVRPATPVIPVWIQDNQFQLKMVRRKKQHFSAHF